MSNPKRRDIYTTVTLATKWSVASQRSSLRWEHLEGQLVVRSWDVGPGKPFEMRFWICGYLKDGERASMGTISAPWDGAW